MYFFYPMIHYSTIVGSILYPDCQRMCFFAGHLIILYCNLDQDQNLFYHHQCLCVFVFVCLCICLGHGSWVLDMGGQNTYWNFFYCQRFPQPGWLAINSMSSSLADCSLDSSSGMGSMLGWFETGVGSNGPLRMIG